MEEMTVPLDSFRANAIILSSRVEAVYPGGLEAFRADWPNRAEDGELIRLIPSRDVDSRRLQSRLRRKGLKPGRDYALTDLKGRPEKVCDGIAFERTMDPSTREISWWVRAGKQTPNIAAFPRVSRNDAGLLRGREYAPMIMIRDECYEAGRLNVQICVNPEGRLVFQREVDSSNGESSGSKRSSWSWSCLTVEPRNVPRVLVELMADRFECEKEFTDWLMEKGIESEVMWGHL